jgi:nucleotide-binding universal stress UspA family protein
MLRRVLVPLDGSPSAETALTHAVAVAGALADGLVLLQVLEPLPGPIKAIDGDVDWRLRRAEANAYLRSLAERLAGRDVDAETVVATGNAADEIVQRARDEAIDLVVLASHGEGQARAFDVGGTCQKILSRSPTSVLLVHRQDQGPQVHEDVAYHDILVPIDGSQASEWALGQAATLARRHGATLHVLHLVVEAPSLRERLPRSSEETELLRQLEELQHDRGVRYLDEIVAKLAHTDLTVRTHVRHAMQLAGAIRSIASELHADLIILSAHGAHGAPFQYGTVAQRLLMESERPVLVLQDAPRRESAEPIVDGS